MDWMEILQECSQKMRRAALRVYGSPKAAVGFGVGAGGDTSKRIDLAAEKALIDCLGKHEISCTLVSEEAGTKKIGFGPSEYYVTTDPVDGTTNAVRGLPFSANVIAVSREPWLRDVETAIVTDIFHNVTYTAQKNKGAFKNGEGIKPSETSDLEEALIGVDLNTFRIEELVAKLEGLFKRGKHFRHFGANALDICYVADGSTDAFIDIRGKLRVTDMAASYLILREAGGIMVSPEGEELNVPLEPTQRLSFIAAANNRIYEAIQEALNS
ncbi:MAG: inositol monophosphatase family protein [Candidatus Wukongarchaeota archaeon]|nr:inositol monophosphatase family protein [Candidatus Wukongarchaeota archaeon]